MYEVQLQPHHNPCMYGLIVNRRCYTQDVWYAQYGVWVICPVLGGQPKAKGEPAGIPGWEVEMLASDI